jgi:hypothetical protein
MMLLLAIPSLSFAQKKEKIRGSKIVTIEKKNIDNFENLEVSDNIEIILIQGNVPHLEIEADDNLQEIIKTEIFGNTLKISTEKSVSGQKKMSIRVTYTENLKMLIAKDEAIITAIDEIKNKEITFKCFDNSNLFINASSKNFTLIANDKSKVELNLKSEDVVLELNRNNQTKALIVAHKLQCDMYQKANAIIEGDVNELKLRLDNSINFIGKKLSTLNTFIISENQAKSYISVKQNLTIDASGKSEIFVYDNPKIDLKRFVDNVALYKKTEK